MGHAIYSAPQLKGMQEIFTLQIFGGFSIWFLGEQMKMKWNPVADFVVIVAALILMFEQ